MSEALTMLAPEVTPSQQMKLLYPDRPWELEPDTAEWYDAKTGYKCRIERQTSSGTLCGYVGVFKGHTAWGMSYDEEGLDVYIHEVHGGLTFSSTDKNGVHWFGFDTAHGGDFCPKIAESMLKYAPESMNRLQGNRLFTGETYRTWEYVEDEVRKLVAALWAVERRGPT